jgi:hypothetical protein
LQKVRSRSERVFSPREELVADDDRWGPGVDVDEDVANHLRLARRAFDAVRVPGEAVTAARRGHARAFFGVTGSTSAGVRCATSRRTREWQRRFKEVAGALPAARFCGENIGINKWRTKQEAKEEERVCRGCASSPRSRGRAQKGRRRTEMAGI